MQTRVILEDDIGLCKKDVKQLQLYVYQDYAWPIKLLQRFFPGCHLVHKDKPKKLAGSRIVVSYVEECLCFFIMVSELG